MPKTATTTDSEAKCPNCGGPMENGACKDDACGYKVPKEDGCMQHGKEEMDSGICDGCSQKDGCTKKPKAKTDGATRVDRIDYWGPLNQISERTEAMETLKSGALRGKAAFTCVGVFRYLAEDGSIRNEFRPPEEVFSKASLESWELAALTNGHPAEKVTPDNYMGLAVGSLGEEIENDAYNVYAEITIQATPAIAAVQAGRTGLSGGYSCDMVAEGTVSYPIIGWAKDPVDGEWKEMETGRTVYKVPGNWGGIPYDEIQTNIVGNHVALVDVPRGGDALHLRFDSADPEVGIRVPPTEAPATKADGTTPQLRTGGETMSKNIRLDGETVEHEVPEAVAIRYDSMKLEIGALTKDKADGEAKLAAANAALETVKTDAAALVASLPAKIQEAVSARLSLTAKADGYGVAVKHEDSDDSIKGAIIVAAMPSVKVDGMDAVSLEAHYTAACSLLDSKKQDGDSGASGSQRQSVADGVPSNNQAPKADSAESLLGSAWKTSK